MREWQRPLYALIGVGAWLAEFVWQLPTEVWRERDRWMRRLGQTYEEMADLGYTTLGTAWGVAVRQAQAAGQQARHIPTVAIAENESTRWSAGSREVPIRDYDRLPAGAVTERLPTLSQRQLHQVEGYETRNKGRSTILSRINQLRGAEPWAGYDEMAINEILPRLRAASPSQQAEVAEHERHHKQRRTILTAARS